MSLVRETSKPHFFEELKHNSSGDLSYMYSLILRVVNEVWVENYNWNLNP